MSIGIVRLLGLLFLIIGLESRAEVVLQPHIEVELVADVARAQSGTDFSLGIRLKPDPEWHVYWENPGASGAPIRMDWTLPAGVKTDRALFPVPSRITVGSLVNFGYPGEVLLIVPVRLSASSPSTTDIKTKVSWLVCQEECIPGEAELSISLPTSDTAAQPSPWSEAFAEARKRLPQDAGKLQTSIQEDGNFWVMKVQGLPIAAEAVQSMFFFPRDTNWIEPSARQSYAIEANGFSLRMAKSDSALSVSDRSGVLRVDTAEGAVGFEVGGVESGSPGVLEAILFAFLGGLILNLMPCVFPVLCIKVLGFAETAGQGSRKVLLHGAAYTGGILFSFWILAGTLIALRAGGEQLGWGFQLQSPAFLAFLCFLLVGMSLNLLGVFEIETSLAGAGQGLASRQGYGGSFFSGMLATVVATPCTAPFMGTAIGFALVQPSVVAFAVFTSLGLGLAAPYVALSVSPALARRLPRPGVWMLTLKQGMAFPLLATVLWLTWVFGLQTGIDSVTLLLGALLVLSFALWIYGKGTRRPRLRAVVMLVTAGLLFWWVARGLEHAPQNSATQSGAWKSFSKAAVDEAIASGSPVFVDFTAAWCITCKVNERVALETELVQKKFQEKKVVLFKADWTNQNEEISRELERHGRNGVPLYLLHAAGKAPVILPQILTPEIVIRALDTLP